LIGQPFCLSDDVKDVCSIGPSLVAIMTKKKDLVIVDSFRGMELHREPLSKIVGKDLTNCKLLADTQDSRLLVLCHQGDCLSISSTSVVNDIGSPTCALADRIESDGRESLLGSRAIIHSFIDHSEEKGENRERICVLSHVILKTYRSCMLHSKKSEGQPRRRRESRSFATLYRLLCHSTMQWKMGVTSRLFKTK